jgi:hypothetical protein
MRLIRYSALLLLLLSLSVVALPRYSVMYNQSCTLCHVDPSGAGQRSLYGAQFFAYTDLAMKQLPMEDMGKVQPMLNDQIQIGFDARVQAYGSDVDNYTTMMAMQGNLYLNFQLNPQWNFYLNKGLYAGFEIWAAGHILPYNGYIKIGRTTPPYGLRLADHKAFVREPLKLGMGWYETGVEIGFHPQKFTFALSMTNGTNVAGQDFNLQTENKAVTARSDVRLPVGPVNLMVGVTGRYSDVAGDQERYGGVYGGIGYAPFFLMGEVDLHDAVGDSDRVAEICSYIEFSYQLTRGFLFRLEHDFHDPNLDWQTGMENMYVAGVEIVPTGFLQIIANLRDHVIDAGYDYPGEDFLEGEVQLHVFF